jgi:hypothetical protein
LLKCILISLGSHYPLEGLWLVHDDHKASKFLKAWKAGNKPSSVIRQNEPTAIYLDCRLPDNSLRPTRES